MPSCHLSTPAARWILLGLAVVVSGCSPQRVEYRGSTLGQATTWTRGGITGSVFVPVGQSLPAADLQVGLLYSNEHATGEALLGWVSGEFQKVPMVKPSVQVTGDESCKAALSNGTETRPFMTLQICRTGVGGSACAEADQRLTDGETTCLAMQFGCFERLCNARWVETRQALEPLVDRLLTEHRP